MLITTLIQHVDPHKQSLYIPTEAALKKIKIY